MRRIVARTAAAFFCAAVVVLGLVGVAAPASAAPATSCSTNPYQNAETVRSNSSAGSVIQLRYSPTCRTAWAKEIDGLVGDNLWVWNENTNVTASTKIHSGTSNYSAAINDAGTHSHACMSGVGLPKTCTAFY